MSSEPNRSTVSFQELAYSNMLTLNALVELLAEKGLVGKDEILERVKQLQAQAGAKARKRPM